MSGLFAPEGGWRVRILDMSGGADDNIVEDVKGFPTLMQANAFSRAYVRDSVELCRAAGASREEVLAAWFAYGEDAHVLDADSAGAPDLADAHKQGWRSATELADFANLPASREERDWRTLDPRRELD